MLARREHSQTAHAGYACELRRRTQICGRVKSSTSELYRWNGWPGTSGQAFIPGSPSVHRPTTASASNICFCPDGRLHAYRSLNFAVVAKYVPCQDSQGIDRVSTNKAPWVPQGLLASARPSCAVSEKRAARPATYLTDVKRDMHTILDLHCRTLCRLWSLPTWGETLRLRG
eukprot:1244202-Rhodomonas_salina.3